MSKQINEVLGVQYSIRKHLEDNYGINTLVHYNGMEYPNEHPFVVIKPMLSPYDFISKGRETVKIEFNFEIALYESSLASLSGSMNVLRNAFIFDTIQYYDSVGTLIEGRNFTIYVNNELQLDAEVITDDKRKHNCYFMVAVEGTLYKNN